MNSVFEFKRLNFKRDPQIYAKTLHRPQKFNRSTFRQSVSALDEARNEWHPLTRPLLWRGGESAALDSSSLPSKLSPPWKVSKPLH